jgi:hypothetical protein
VKGQVKEVEIKKCEAVCGSSSICSKKVGHFGKHYDGAGTSWTDQGVAERIKREEAVAKCALAESRP